MDLNRANDFYRQRHDAGKGAGGVGGGGAGGRPLAAPAPKKPERVHPGTNQPIKAPKTLPAFPKAIPVKAKSSVQGGGGLRERWESKRHAYDWDSQHGRVEKYSKATREHLGEFNPNTGQQTKPADPTMKLRV